MKHAQIKTSKLGEDYANDVSKSGSYIPLFLIFGLCIPLLFSNYTKLRIFGTLLQILVACSAFFWGYKNQKLSKLVMVLGSFALAVSAFVIIGYTYLN
jgi:hypothetical protein